MNEVLLEHSCHVIFACGTVSQILEDLEACDRVWVCTRILVGRAAAQGVKVRTRPIQPRTTTPVGKSEAHDIPILHRSTIHCIPGEDLEDGVRVAEPMVSCEVTGYPEKKKQKKQKKTQTQANKDFARSQPWIMKVINGMT